MIKNNILSLLFTSISTFGLCQSSLENDRIAELYDLISDKRPLYGSQVHIYDYKLKNKKTIKDSSFVAMFSIVDNQEGRNQIYYDTIDQIVT